jgi:DNA-binding GntR family transcriptional regulator
MLATSTRQEAAYSSLRRDILMGNLKPGQKLPFNLLCPQYNVSVGVIREVLSRLVEQDLVVSAPQQGYTVKAISRADLLHLTTARREIETLTLRHALAEGDVMWESELLAALHRLSSCPMEDHNNPGSLTEPWVRLHQEFHETLLDGCNNPRLTGVAKHLRASAELYRQWSAQTDESHTRDIAAEHKAIVDAALARDTKRAVKLLDAHIALTTELILQSGLAGPE